LREERTLPRGDPKAAVHGVTEENLRCKTLPPLVERLHLGTPAGPPRRTLLFEWGRMVLQLDAEEN